MSAQPSTATKNPTAQVGPEPLTSTPCSPKSDSNSKAMDSLLATFASYKSKILASPINTPTSTTANSTPISPYPSPFPCQTSNTNPDSDSIVTRRISITLLPMKVPILKMPVPRKRKSGVSVAQATPVPGPVLYSTPTPAAATENLSRIERKNSPARRASVIVQRVRHSSQVATLETCDDDSASDVESSQDDEDADQEAEFETEQQQQNAKRNRRRRLQERGVLTVFPGIRHDSYVAVVETCSPLVGDFRERDGHFLLQEAEDKNDAGWRGEIVEDVVSEYPPTRYQPWAQGPELSTRNPGEKSVSDSADRLVNWDEGVSPRSLDIVSEMSRTWKSVEKPGKAATVFKTETGERTKSVSDYSSSLPGTPGTFPLQGKEFFGGEAEPVSPSMMRGSHLRERIEGREVFDDLELGEMDVCWES